MENLEEVPMFIYSLIPTDLSRQSVIQIQWQLPGVVEVFVGMTLEDGEIWSYNNIHWLYPLIPTYRNKISKCGGRSDRAPT